jgi:hypothetical protein
VEEGNPTLVSLAVGFDRNEEGKRLAWGVDRTYRVIITLISVVVTVDERETPPPSQSQ